MNDSEKASEMKRVVDAKYERYARCVAEQLNDSNSPVARNPKSPSTTHWEEWKIHLREQQLVQCARLEEYVTTACFRLLDGLPADERRTLWLASDAADQAKPDWWGKTGSSELMADLYERVKDLALEEAEREADFGAGFVHDPRIDFEKIVKPLAEFLEGSELSRELGTELDRHMVYNRFRPGLSRGELGQAVQEFLVSNPQFLDQEARERALEVPDEYERGEVLFTAIMLNL